MLWVFIRVGGVTRRKTKLTPARKKKRHEEADEQDSKGEAASNVYEEYDTSVWNVYSWKV